MKPTRTPGRTVQVVTALAAALTLAGPIMSHAAKPHARGAVHAAPRPRPSAVLPPSPYHNFMRIGADDPLLLKAFALTAISAGDRFAFVAEITQEIMGTTKSGDITRPLMRDTCHLRVSYNPFAEPGEIWQQTDFESQTCREMIGQTVDAWKALPRGELATGGIDDRARVYDCIPLEDREEMAVFECRIAFPGDLPEAVRWGPDHSVSDFIVDPRTGRLVSSTSLLTSPAKYLKSNMVEVMTTEVEVVVFRSGVTRTRQMTGEQSGISKRGLLSMRYRILTTIKFRFPGIQLAE